MKLLATALATLLIGSIVVTQLAPALGDVPARAAGATAVTRSFQAPSTTDTAYRDSWYNSRDNANNGTATTLSVKSTANATCATSGGPANSCSRAVLWFDLSNLPGGSTVTAASADLNATSAGASARTHGLHPITASWTETGVTWTSRNGTNDWTTAGGDFNATASQTVSTGTGTGVKTFVDVAALRSDVSGWINTAANNFGWLLKDESETSGANITWVYGAKNNATLGNRPKLSVTYTAVWDSYSDSGRTVQSDNLTAPNQETVYMQGTGFNLGGSYIVAYYDSTGYKACTDTVAASGGTLNSSCRLLAGGAGAAGTWHAVVFQPTGSAAATYSAIVADTNLEVADDTFTVAAGALVPEFPSVAASATVMVLLATVYFWFSRKPERALEREVA